MARYSLEGPKNKSRYSLTRPEDSEDEFLPPKKEGIEDWLPRDIMIGLLNQRQNMVNTPHDISKGFEENNKKSGELFNKTINLEKYLGQGELPFGSREPNMPFSAYLPHEQNDFSKLMGQEGEPSSGSWLIQKGIEHAPEILGISKLAAHLTPQRIKDIFGHGSLTRKSEKLNTELNQAEHELEGIEKSTEHETNAANLLENNANEEVSKYLNKGATHSSRGASAISHRLNNIENYWKGSYKQLKDNLKNSEFKMEELPKYANDLENTIKNIKDVEFVNGKLVIKNQPQVSAELQSIFDKAPTPKDISASDFLTKYQDFRDSRYDLLQRAKTTEKASERRDLFKAYEDSKPIEETVKKALNEGLGEHQSEFKRINEGYSTQIYPLRNNKVAQKALSGNLGTNTLEKLAGTGEGQELMREIVKQDPELLRNIVGQRYASKPGALKDIDENTAEFLNEMPQLKKIMSENESSINQQLEKVNQLKNKKEISLKDKIRLENEHKELKIKLNRIQKDKNKIWKGAKKAAGYGTALYLGGNVINKVLGK